MTGNDPFDRQLTRGLEHLAGPEPFVDVDDIAERAIRPQPRWRLPSPFRMAQVVAAAAVVALFGGFLLLAGVLDPTDDSDLVGASPTASDRPAPTDAVAPATFAPAKVTYASGTLVPIEEPMEDTGGEDDEPAIDLAARGLDVLGYGTTRYTVSSSDPRLEGIATVIDIEGYWDHETTTDDIDAVDPEGPWQLEVSVARLEIQNEQGAWSGTVGPAFYASGTASVSGDSGGLPGFDQVGPTILEGSGEYAGLWAVMQLMTTDGPGSQEAWVPDGSQASTYEAIVVNRQIPGPQSDRLWNELTNR